MSLSKIEVAEVLENLGYTVKVSGTAAEAMAALAQQEYDILSLAEHFDILAASF